MPETMKRGGKRKINSGMKAWLAFVKRVQKEENIEKYGDAIKRAKQRKDKGEKWMGGAQLADKAATIKGGRNEEPEKEEEEQVSTDASPSTGGRRDGEEMPATGGRRDGEEMPATGGRGSRRSRRNSRRNRRNRSSRR